MKTNDITKAKDPALRGAMDADDFRDYVLSLIFPRYLSDNYEAAAKLGKTCDDRNAKLCAIIHKIAEEPCPGLQPSLVCGAQLGPESSALPGMNHVDLICRNLFPTSSFTSSGARRAAILG